MSGPYDPPILWLASLHNAEAAAMEKCIHLVAGQRIPHILTDSQVLTIRSTEDIHIALGRQEKQTLLNSVVVLDLSTVGLDDSFDLKASVYQQLCPFGLVLQYPEVYWIFVVPSRPGGNETSMEMMGVRPEMLAYHFVPVNQFFQILPLLSRHAAGFRVLLDPTGLRYWTMLLSLPSIAKRPSRLDHGLAIEDELSYALLNGYLLYRQRCGTFLVTTLSEYRRTAELALNSGRLYSETWRVIEDAELSFADAEEKDLQDAHLLPSPGASEEEMLQKRGATNGIIAAAASRTVISTVRLDPADLTSSAQQELRVRIKPHRGLYGDVLWSLEKHNRPSVAAGIKRALSNWLLNVYYLSVLFIWLRPKETAIYRNKSESHSAPGAHQELASQLVRRCRRGADTVATPEDAIQLAVLADVAYQLLQQNTPHLSLEALGLRHHMEVEAECMFIGTSNSLDVQLRLDDLEREVESVVRYEPFDFSSKLWKRNQQRCNAMLEICADLRDVYHSHDQRDEEDDLLTAFRRWRRRAYMNGRTEWTSGCFGWSWVRGFCRSLAAYLWAYMNFILRSWGRLAIASLGWILLFAFLYQSAARSEIVAGSEAGELLEHLKLNIVDWTIQSTATFVGLQQALSGDIGGENLVQEVARLCSLTHDPIKRQPVDVGQVENASSVIKRDAEVQLERLRPVLRYWWLLYTLEMLLGYIHAAGLIYLILSRFGRK